MEKLELIQPKRVGLSELLGLLGLLGLYQEVVMAVIGLLEGILNLYVFKDAAKERQLLLSLMNRLSGYIYIYSYNDD